MLSPKMKIFCMADLLRLAGVAKLLMVWQTDTRSSPSALWILPRCKHYTDALCSVRYTVRCHYHFQKMVCSFGSL